MTDAVDTPDPADMARWLRERKEAVVEFLKLDSEDQQRQFLNRWQQNVLPHLAFRFVQAAEMIERLAEDCRELIAERDGLTQELCSKTQQLAQFGPGHPLGPWVRVEGSPEAAPALEPIWRIGDRIVSEEEGKAAMRAALEPKAPHPDTARLDWILNDYRGVDLYNALDGEIGVCETDLSRVRAAIDKKISTENRGAGQ